MAVPLGRSRWRVFALGCLGVLTVAAGVAVWQRSALEAWYLAHRLEGAPEAERQGWADRLAALGEPAVPRLLGCLGREDAGLSEAARVALARMVKGWGAGNARVPGLVQQVCDCQSSLSPGGQAALLELIPDLVAGGPESAGALHPLVAAGLRGATPEQREAAIACALRPEFNLLAAVVPLLGDPSAEVRRAAMLAVGPHREDAEPVVATEALLHHLHDDDAEVRRLCEMALRSRGLGERDIRLGRQITDPDPVGRLGLLLELSRDEDFPAESWLERLSNDPSSAVRAGAARVAAERRIDFAERLQEMSRSDPDATVRRIAAHYRRLYADASR